MAKKTETKTRATTAPPAGAAAPDAERTTAAAREAAHPGDSAPGSHYDLSPEESKMMLDVLLHPGGFAHILDHMPEDAGAARAALRVWGSLRGHYPADVTYNRDLPRPPALRTHEVQPGVMPTSADVTLGADDVDDVFEALMEAITAWERSEDVLENAAAHRRLIRLLRAGVVMADASLEAMKPLVDAHYEDRRAAKEWELQRWFTRGRLARRRAEAASAAATAADSGGAPSPAPPAAAAAPAAPLKDGTNG